MGQIRRVTRKAWLCFCVSGSQRVWNSFAARHIRMCFCVFVVVVASAAAVVLKLQKRQLKI